VNSKETLTFVSCRIWDLCEAKGISPRELAIGSGLPPSTLYSILNGKSRKPGIETLEKICKALSISLREFWTSSALSGRP